MKIQHQASIRAYRAGGFIGTYQRLVKDVVIPYQYSVLCDEAPDTEKSHVIQNFINAGKVLRSKNGGSAADCGDGFYGLKVHEAALARGVKLTGATVHYVDEGMDSGPIILQKAVEVKEGDTPQTLQRRVMEEAEWKILPQAIQMIANGGEA